MATSLLLLFHHQFRCHPCRREGNSEYFLSVRYVSSSLVLRPSLYRSSDLSTKGQVQNCIANLQVNYNTSRASYLPTTLPRRPDKIIAPKSSPLAAYFERKVQGQNLPLRPLPCLLLKPVSTRSPLLRSTYRPTRASVLSSHIEGVVSCHQAIASIICCAPWL